MIPGHLEIALDELGVEEYPGPENNPRVLEYHATTTLGDWGRSRDHVPWCSSFVNACMVWAYRDGWGTNNALARSWLRWRFPTDDPKLGDVCVIRRRRRGPDARTGSRGGNHVGLFMDRTRGGLVLLSGNTDDRVGIDFFSDRRWETLAFRTLFD